MLRIPTPRRRPTRSARKMRRAFTLVELVMVVTIIGTVSAIAVPRISSASQGAAQKAMDATLVSIRKAIDTYYAEHSKYPGANAVTGAPDGVAFVDQLLQYSDRTGKTSASYGSPFIYGPYLRAPFPKSPTNKLNTVMVKASPTTPDPAPGAAGWIAVLSHGYFDVHATTVDLRKVGIETIRRDGAKLNN